MTLVGSALFEKKRATIAEAAKTGVIGPSNTATIQVRSNEPMSFQRERGGSSLSLFRDAIIAEPPQV
jgi:hypothetical protein